MSFIPGTLQSYHCINMIYQEELFLKNPHTNALAFKILPFANAGIFESLHDFNYYSVVLLKKGAGTVLVDLRKYDFRGKTLLKFPIYQPFRIVPVEELEGVLIQLHSEFFSTHKYQTELPCKKALFKNIDESPVIELTDQEIQRLLAPLNNVLAEFDFEKMGKYDMAISWIKIFLIQSSRMKLGRGEVEMSFVVEEPRLMRHLIGAVEEQFRFKHSPVDYAGLLNVTVKKLNRIARQYLGKTISSMIMERVIAEARRQLYLSDMPVKQIARDIGFKDEAYFSRVFKTHEGLSPQTYRDKVKFREN